MSETPAPTPTLAKHAKVTRQPGRTAFDVEIDGQPFPWYVASDDGVKVQMSTERVSAITVTILVEHIELEDQMMRHRAEDVLAGHFHDEMAEQVIDAEPAR